jgi:hypothetical protein
MIPALLALAAVVQADPARDTIVSPTTDSVASAPATPLAAPRPAAATARDTVPPRAIDMSPAYERRLAIHRWGGFAMLPLFGAQYVLGERILQQKTDIKAGVRTEPIDHDLRLVHRFAAYGVAGVFTVNTVTGAWNLWDSRGVTDGRGLRTAHTLMMLAADAGFVISGKKGFDHQKHRNVAIGSMSLATLSGLMMYLADR